MSTIMPRLARLPTTNHERKTMTKENEHRDYEAQPILDALRACAASVPPIIVPSAMSGPRTGYNTLSLRPEFPETMRSGRPAKRRFWRQIETLRQMHQIDECEYRRSNRHVTAQIVLTAEGLRQCAE